MTRKNLSIGLLWHSLRCNNLGNGALTISHLRMLTQAADFAKTPISIRVIQGNGPLSYPPEGIAIHEEILGGEPYDHVLPMTQLWRAVSECDFVLDVGNGDLFTDLYGTDCFFLVSCYRVAVLAQGVPLILSPQTIGPFSQPDLKSLAAQLCANCEKVFARDAESLGLLKEMGVSSAEETVDLAFSLPFTTARPTPRRTINFGLNVSGLLFLDDATKRFDFGLRASYPEMIRTMISKLKRRKDVSIVLVPHVVGDGEIDDIWICKKLASEYDLELAPKFSSPVEAKNFIASLDVLVASRMHATIAAVSSGVPAIPLAYSRKFRGVLRSIDYPVVCDLLTEDSDSICSCVDDVLSRLGELRSAAWNSSVIAHRKLSEYQSYLNQLVLSPPRRKT